MKKVQYIFRDNLRRMKEKKGCTYEEIADSICVSFNTVQSWLLGNNFITAHSLDLLCLFFNCSPMEFFRTYNGDSREYDNGYKDGYEEGYKVGKEDLTLIESKYNELKKQRNRK